MLEAAAAVAARLRAARMADADRALAGADLRRGHAARHRRALHDRSAAPFGARWRRDDLRARRVGGRALVEALGEAPWWRGDRRALDLRVPEARRAADDRRAARFRDGVIRGAHVAH